MNPNHTRIESMHDKALGRETPQPIPGTLLAAFTRFADLSCYWHRHGTPDSLAVNELQERTRLAVDIPEMIRRLTAFAELGTDQMFDAYASAKAEPPKEVAEEWRMLEAGEEIMRGDELRHRTTPSSQWGPVCTCIGCDVSVGDSWEFRRRIAKEPPKDTVGHIQADYEPNEALGGKESQEPPAGDGWRWMEPGEIIEKGDLVVSRPVSPEFECIIGLPVAKGQFHIYRRRITPTPATEPPQP